MLSFDRVYFAFVQKPFIWVGARQPTKDAPMSPARPSQSDNSNGNNDTDDADSDEESEQAVLAMLAEGLDLADTDTPSPAPRGTARTNVYVPQAFALPADLESDNDLAHALYCVAETCIANGIIYPPAFSWPDPWHDAGPPDEVVTIPPLSTHPKLVYIGGRYTVYRPVIPPPSTPLVAFSPAQSNRNGQWQNYKS